MSRPNPGDLVNLAEADYRYGRGAVTLRVREVRPAAEADWITLVGDIIIWNGDRLPVEAVLTARVAGIKLARDSR